MGLCCFRTFWHGLKSRLEEPDLIDFCDVSDCIIIALDYVLKCYNFVLKASTICVHLR